MNTNNIQPSVPEEPLRYSEATITNEGSASPEKGSGDLEKLKVTEATQLEKNLEGAKGNSLNILNMVLAGLIVSIPSYIGLGWMFDHMTFVSEGTKTMARLGTMMGIRPVLNSLTNILRGNVISPTTKAIKDGLGKGKNSEFAQKIKNAIAIPNSSLSARPMPA